VQGQESVLCIGFVQIQILFIRRILYITSLRHFHLRRVDDNNDSRNDKQNDIHASRDKFRTNLMVISR
jgi:hypothetical protein